MEIVFSDKCLKFKQEGHPESPERVRLAYEHLKDYYKIVKPSACFDKELLNAHTKRLVDSVKNKSFYDADCPLYDNIFDYASLSAGAAIMAAKKQGFSLMRPPGHHAGKDSLGGFCYFNNIAVAVKSLGKKTLILDIDAHHGNGTQDVFLGDENVTYVSLHKSPE
ncbi:histone deacetylase, partial [Candidatus Woesearchaeota archaeon]|nr:histone deacetylase [Candidatus Woesearchaeota archaeon]